MLPETGVLAKYRYRFCPLIKNTFVLTPAEKSAHNSVLPTSSDSVRHGVGTSLRFELALATDNSCTLPFPPVSPHSYTNIHTAFECITHTYHDGGKRYSREKANPSKEYEEKRRREEAVSQPHYYYSSIGGAEPPRSVCDGDHGACERTRMDVEARRGAGTRRAHGTNSACGVQCSHLVLQPSRLLVPLILSQPTHRAPIPH